MVVETLTNIYFKICGNRKLDNFNPDSKFYLHPYNINNKSCSSCYEKVKFPKHISKVWKKIHVFCDTNCYHKWLIQFN